MTELPSGWIWVQLAEVADVQGGIQKQAKRRPVQNKYPFLRVANVHRGRLDLADVHEVELFDGELERFELRRGDLLVVEGNGSPDQIGRAATWDGSIANCVHQNHLIRVRPTSALRHKYLELVWNSPLIARHLRNVAGSTTGLYTLSTAKLNAVPLPLPPLAEQDRIVSALEAQLSRMTAASAALETANRRTTLLRRALLKELRIEAISAGGRFARLGEVATTSLGKMLDAARNSGEWTPYLRNVNVRWGWVDLTKVEEVRMSAEERLKFNLRVGDLLVCEGGEPGRCAVWKGGAMIAYQKALHRVRAKSGVDPNWLALSLEEAVRNKRTAHLETGSTIKHLPQEKLRQVEVVVPELNVQRRLVDEFAALESGVSFFVDSFRTLKSRIESLQGELLTKAFSGQLVSQDPNDEPASQLLSAVRAERSALPPRQKARNGRIRKELAAPPNRVTGDDYQQEALPL